MKIESRANCRSICHYKKWNREKRSEYLQCTSSLIRRLTETGTPLEAMQRYAPPCRRETFVMVIDSPSYTSAVCGEVARVGGRERWNARCCCTTCSRRYILRESVSIARICTASSIARVFAAVSMAVGSSCVKSNGTWMPVNDHRQRFEVCVNRQKQTRSKKLEIGNFLRFSLWNALRSKSFRNGGQQMAANPMVR